MALHVLAGPRDLLRPEPLPLETLAGLLGERVRPATAFWLLPEHGYHDFLLEDAGDLRVEVFARSLAENFGTRFEPLVVLPDLLAEAGDGDWAVAEAGAAARAALAEIWRHRPAARMVLHALALPAGIDDGDGWTVARPVLAPRLEADLAALRDGLAPAPGAVAVAVTEPRAGSAAFAGLLRNALAGLVAARAGDRLARAGLAPQDSRLRPALARLLADWDRAGLAPVRPLGTEALERLGERLTEALLLRGVAADG